MELTCKKHSVTRTAMIGSLALSALVVNEAQAGEPSKNVELMSHLALSDFDGNPTSGNDCWGYVSASGREYALMGLRTSVAVVEITDPANPVIIDQVTHSESSWCDIKVYGDYAYASNETGGGIDIIDLTDVDNGVVTYVGAVAGTDESHNVAIDATSGFLYLCGANTNGGRLIAFDLSNPANPTLAGQMPSSDGEYVHDAQIVTFTEGPNAGKQIAFSADGGAGFSIYDVTDKSNMFLIKRISYPNLSYSHQCWLSSDRQFLYLNDELDGVNETVIFNVSDLANPTVAGTYNSGLGAVDHNVYAHNGFIYEAEYTAGLRIFDASDPLNPVQVGWYDTFLEHDDAEFLGAWSVYPFFPSGNVLISDKNTGLYIVKPSVQPCIWDLDDNGSVGLSDLLDLLSAWGPNPGHPADFDGDDTVGISDLLVMLANWGPCP